MQVAREIHGPGVPCLGVRSAVPSSFLPPGLLASAINARVVKGAIKARGGTARLGVVSLFGNLRGGDSFVLDGKRVVVAAFEQGGFITFGKSEDSGATWTYFGLTVSGGPYNGRVYDIGSASFAVVRDHGRSGVSDTDALVVSVQADPLDTGKNPVYVYAKATENGGGAAAGTYVFAPTVDVPIPTSATLTISLPSGFPIATVGSSTITNGGSGFFTGAHSVPMLSIQAAPGALTGDSVDFAFAAGLDFSTAKQLVLLASDQNEFVTGGNTWHPILNALKVEIGSDATHWTTLCNAGEIFTAGTVLAGAASEIRDGAGNDVGSGYQIGLPIPGGGAAVLTAIKRIRFTWNGGTVAASNYHYALVSVVGPSGASVGNPNVAVCGYGSDHRCISPPAYASAGNATIATPSWSYYRPRYLELAFDSALAFNVSLSVTRPNYSAGTNKLLIFTQLSGQSDYYFTDTVQVGHWSGAAWVNDTADPTPWTYVDSLTQDLTYPVPPDTTTCPPKSQAISSINARLFAGGDQIFWFSQYQRPFWFSRAAVTDDAGEIVPEGPSSALFEGEAIKAIVPLGRIGVSPNARGQFDSSTDILFAVTDRSVRAISGWDAESLLRPVIVAKVGTLSPRSVEVGRDALFFLSSERQVVRLRAGNVDVLSRDEVDDGLLQIPDAFLPSVSGAFWRGKYYVTRCRAGQTKADRILVWDEDHQLWHGEDKVGSLFFGDLVSHVASAGPVLLLLEDATGIYQHEASAGDLGTGFVPVTVEFPEASGDMDQLALVEHVAVRAGSAAGASLTATLKTSGNKVHADQSATISLDAGAANGQTLTRQTGRLALRSEGVRLVLDLSVPGGTPLYAVWANVSGDSTGADVAP